jgi:hypothetical protein
VHVIVCYNEKSQLQALKIFIKREKSKEKKPITHFYREISFILIFVTQLINKICVNKV